MFDAFGNDLAAKRVSKSDGRLNHQTIASVFDNSANEALVDLDLDGGNFLKVIESGLACAIVIDRKIELRAHEAG